MNNIWRASKVSGMDARELAGWWHVNSNQMPDDGAESDLLQQLENRVIHGNKEALAQIFSLYRERLRRIVNFRIDRHIYGRIDSEDILQEAYLNAEQRLKFLLRDRPATVFIWLRQIVNQTLIDVHRRHLGAQKRSA